MNNEKETHKKLKSEKNEGETEENFDFPTLSFLDYYTIYLSNIYWILFVLKENFKT